MTFFQQVTADGLVPIRLGVLTASGIDYGPEPVGTVSRLRMHAAVARGVVGAMARARLHAAAAVGTSLDPGAGPEPTPARARLHAARVFATSAETVAHARLHQAHGLGYLHTPPVVPVTARAHVAGPVVAQPRLA